MASPPSPPGERSPNDIDMIEVEQHEGDSPTQELTQQFQSWQLKKRETKEYSNRMFAEPGPDFFPGVVPIFVRNHDIYRPELFDGRLCDPFVQLPSNFYYQDQRDKRTRYYSNASSLSSNSRGSPPDAASTVSQPNSEAFTPIIRLYTVGPVNLTNANILFNVFAFHIPPDCDLHPGMLEGYVETPSGKRMLCMGFQLNRRQNLNEVDTFTGAFRSTEEIGVYTLSMRLLLPMSVRALHSTFGCIIEDFPVLVTRNYCTASQNMLRVHRLETVTGQSNLTYQDPGQDIPYPCKPQFPPIQENDWKNQMEETVEEDLTPVLEKCYAQLWGLTADKHTCRLYYTDRLADTFIDMDALTGQEVCRFPPKGYSVYQQGLMSRPTGICFDHFNRRVLVCDKNNHRVTMYSPNGIYIGSFGSRGQGNGQFLYPWDVAVDHTGDKIAVTDSKNKRVQLFDKHGAFVATFSHYEDNKDGKKANFQYPRGLTFCKDGSSIYVNDFNVNNVIEIFVSKKEARKLVPEGSVFHPQGIALDSFDNLLVADSSNQAIRHVCPRERVVVNHILKAGRERYTYPLNVAILAGDRVAVLDHSAKIFIF